VVSLLPELPKLPELEDEVVEDGAVEVPVAEAPAERVIEPLVAAFATNALLSKDIDA